MNAKHKRIAYATLKMFILISIYLFVSVLISFLPYLNYFPLRSFVAIVITYCVADEIKIGGE